METELKKLWKRCIEAKDAAMRTEDLFQVLQIIEEARKEIYGDHPDNAMNEAENEGANRNIKI